MRRSRALILLVLVLLMIGSYLVWCARPFYRPPPIEFAPEVSQEMQDYIIAWHRDLRFFEAERFKWSRYRDCLINPYESGIQPIQVIKAGEGVFSDEEHVMALHRSRSAWVDFQRDRYGWTPPTIQCDGPPGFKTKPKGWPPPK